MKSEEIDYEHRQGVKSGTDEIGARTAEAGKVQNDSKITMCMGGSDQAKGRQVARHLSLRWQRGKAALGIRRRGIDQ